MSKQFKDDMQTIIVMPQGLQKMLTPDMWPEILKGDFWLIDRQHSVEASKKIQTMNDWVDPNNQKEKLKKWKALVVWSKDDTRLSDISGYFNMGNKKRTYQASWIRTSSIKRWPRKGVERTQNCLPKTEDISSFLL